jgi:hypothetical protein
MKKKHHPFYGEEILRDREQELIRLILRKYRHESADGSLQEKIYNDLMQAKHEGKIKIPFKVIMRQDPSHHAPPYIEVLLDTKV